MNSCYVLIKETNLDTLGYKNQTNPYSATKTVRVFSDFENAKQHMQNILKEYAGKKIISSTETEIFYTWKIT